MKIELSNEYKTLSERLSDWLHINRSQIVFWIAVVVAAAATWGAL